MPADNPAAAIREADPTDIPQLAALHVEAFREAHGRHGAPTFELREQMELGPRGTSSLVPHELNVVNVQSREREITKEEYDKTIQL